MTSNRSVKVIIDTNVWISFLIGKKLSYLKSLISNRDIVIVVCDTLLSEIELVANRPHLVKYNTAALVDELFVLLETIGESYAPVEKHHGCRDPKDNFLLDLIDISGAEYLVTGDKDLLVLGQFLKTRILTAAEFENVINKS